MNNTNFITMETTCHVMHRCQVFARLIYYIISMFALTQERLVHDFYGFVNWFYVHSMFLNVLHVF